jgi:hypothetical protein
MLTQHHPSPSSDTNMNFIFKDFKVAGGVATEGRRLRAVSFVMMSILVQEMDVCMLFFSLPVMQKPKHV